MDLIQELERQRQTLLAFATIPDISEEACLAPLRDRNNRPHCPPAMTGKIGQYLRDNEWLMGIKSRAAIPGGSANLTCLPITGGCNCPDQRGATPSAPGPSLLLLRMPGHRSYGCCGRAASQTLRRECRSVPAQPGGSAAQMVRVTVALTIRPFPR